MDMNTLLGGLDAERRARQGLPYSNAFLRDVHAEHRARQGLPAPPIQGYGGCGRGRSRSRSRSRDRRDRGRRRRDDSSSRSRSRGIEAPAPVEPPAPVVEAPAQDMALDEVAPPSADADDAASANGSVRDPDEVVVEQLIAVEPPLMRPDQAEQRGEEAVAVAVEKCAADTAGQRCYICYGEGDEDEGLVRGCSCRGDNGVAHVSCLARAAQVTVERVAQNGWKRWSTCGLCEQYYHGVVACALGWACWKTYAGRPETSILRQAAMTELGNGLFNANHHEDALSVFEAGLSMKRRLGASEASILLVQSNIAGSYLMLKRFEEANRMRRDVYSDWLELEGEEHEYTLIAANNYANSLIELKRFKEAKPLLRKTIPVARRVLGDDHRFTLTMRWGYADTLYKASGAMLGELREAVTTLEDIERIARRGLGGAHPYTMAIERNLPKARAKLRAREDAEPDVSTQELDAAEAAAAAAVAAAALKRRRWRENIERERVRSG